MMRAMSLRLKITLALEALFFILLLSFVGRPTRLVQLGLVLAAPVLLVLWSAAVGDLLKRKNGWARMAAVGVLLTPAAWAAAFPLGGPLRGCYFRRDLPRMREAVRLMESGAVVVDREQPLKLPDEYVSPAYAIKADRDEKGLTVLFFVGAGFPVKHLAYLYRSDDTIPPEIRREWSRSIRRRPCWYELSD